MESAIANRGLDLEKELTCSICTEVLYQPLTLLDCLHTFCGACLKEWFSYISNSSHASPQYTCPSCRAEVRDTKHNATVTTLLEMFLAKNPEKGRTEEEKAEVAKTYKIGDQVLVKREGREKSLRERREEDADRRLVDSVREASLRDAGVGGASESEGRRERRLRAESRDISRSSYDSERRRRRDDARARDDSTLQPEVGTEERRRRRSNEERRPRNEETTRTAARQIEHQSSLRSLISSSDVDSREMEEEILRQIREEGLLDGIDLENIDVSQEDQISERIAEAFRRRQSERAQQTARGGSRRPEVPRTGTDSRETSGDDGRRSTSRRREMPRSRTDSRERSGDDGARSSSRRRTRTHSRAPSAVSTADTSRPPQSMSAIQAAQLEVQSSDEGRHRRRRTTSNSRSSTTPVPVAEPEARPATRSSTDLSDRPQSMHLPNTRPVSANSRSSTDPTTAQATELPVPETRLRHSVELPVSESRPAARQAQTTSAKSSPRMRSTAQMEDVSTERRNRAAAPADISVSSGLPAASQLAANRSLVPAPLSPRVPQGTSLSERANALSSGSRPNSSSSAGSRKQQFFPEPSIACHRCLKPHIEYTLHYNCGICSDGNYNICLTCYRSGKGCLHWFGFGQAAWTKWEKISQGGSANVETPHMLKASRYVAPKIVPGGADGRRTLTNEDPEKRLQSGTFCANCFSWTNECYWRCNLCNDGDWGFCHPCVNQGKSCTHPLLPLIYSPAQGDVILSPIQDHQPPTSATILTGPNVVNYGHFRPLTFKTSCDICRQRIEPTESRYHCFQCTSKMAGTLPGDYDICITCYPKLVSSRRISAENGEKGWRRCLQGHRMAIIGFEDNRSGQRRIVVKDIVGGRGLHSKVYVPKVQDGANSNSMTADLMKWSWGDGIHIRGDDCHAKLVTKDPMKSPPPVSPSSSGGGGGIGGFPPDGGVGMIGVALWSWYPAEGADDELLFPRGAVITECKDVNGDWWFGVYMGRGGLFPSNYLRVLDRGPG